jgi:hypothetical protein
MPIIAYPERNREICERYRAGETIPALARAYTVTPQCISQIIKRTDPSVIRKRTRDINVAEAYLRYRDDVNTPIADIAADYGVSTQCLVRKFEKYDLARNRRERGVIATGSRRTANYDVLAERYAHYLDGEDIDSIATLFAPLKAPVVSRSFKRAGLPVLGFWLRKSTKDVRQQAMVRMLDELNGVTTEDIDTWYHHYAEGERIDAIAEDAGVLPSTVWFTLKQSGHLMMPEEICRHYTAEERKAALARLQAQHDDDAGHDDDIL